jgi:hypothetical protein
MRHKEISEAIFLIKQSIHNKSPLSLVRIGDGEINILKERGGSDDWNQRVISLNETSTIEEAFSINKPFIENAIAKADILGLLDPKSKYVSFNYDENLWSISDEYILRFRTSMPMIVDHQISRSRELGSVQGMRDLLSGKAIHIISPNVDRLKERKISELLGSKVSFTDNSMSIKHYNRQPIIDSFKNIREDIVLLGVGPHKDYCTILKEHGKIAIDLGATLDAWAGLKTRGWFEKGNLQEYLFIE